MKGLIKLMVLDTRFRTSFPVDTGRKLRYIRRSEDVLDVFWTSYVRQFTSCVYWVEWNRQWPSVLKFWLTGIVWSKNSFVSDVKSKTITILKKGNFFEISRQIQLNMLCNLLVKHWRFLRGSRVFISYYSYLTDALLF